MTTPAYNDTNFRAQFPAFQSQVQFPEATLSTYWTMGTSYIATCNANTCAWSSAQAQLANDLMGAHIAYGMNNAINGAPGGVMTGATEGSVSITFAPPPTKSGFDYWLASSPYGSQLRALLGVTANVGLFVGGSLDRASFRKAGGVW